MYRYLELLIEKNPFGFLAFPFIAFILVRLLAGKNFECRWRDIVWFMPALLNTVMILTMDVLSWNLDKNLLVGMAIGTLWGYAIVPLTLFATIIGIFILALRNWLPNNE